MTQSRRGAAPPRSELAGEKGGLRIEGLTCLYGDTVAVDDLHLDVRPGEFFTLLGPSGCGKSTTLMTVAGFLAPHCGRIWVSGEDVTDRVASRRPTNYVFQNYALFPHLTIAENVAFGLKRRRVGREEIRARVATELERVDLAHLARRRPHQLSGGQQQRVALARALVNRPDLLLLDEPLAALDHKLRTQLRSELRAIQQEVGTTTVLVTHDQDEALSLSDRVAVMNAGRIEQIDVPEAVYETPTTTFVANFLGTSNLLPGTVVKAWSGTCIVALDLGPTVDVSVEGVPTLQTGDRCSVMVRPEYVQAGATTGDGLSLPARRGATLYEGDSYEVTFTLDDDSAVKVRLSGADHARMTATGAASLHLHVPHGHLRVLAHS